ncbi:patatin-like phospholipase family protein [Bacillus pinisoli]|uniref:patatin-like phospholipase family protein n=1 Tax=Bacillus pinisoli TaxID=2901866 RepID=UPI001FF5DB1E
MKIDGVFSGGGIKGYALIGAISAIEEKGYRFVRVAGSSAGALIATFISAGYTAKEIKALMEEAELKHFLDPRKSWAPDGIAKWLFLYWRLGLYKGEALEQWVEKKLLDKQIRVFGDLPTHSLRIIASDLTNSRMMVIPDDLPSYGLDPSTFSIAKAVRMSASIPYFFEPTKLKKKDGVTVIVDGALLSNFPVWLFEQTRNEKKRPLLGVQLSPDLSNRVPNKIRNGFDLFKALFETMMDAHDLKYISKNVEKNIIFIPVDSVKTREFDIAGEQKRELIEKGYQHAKQFLQKWSY